MIKDTRYIIKRVIIGVLICLILSFIRTCEVNAASNIQSVWLGYDSSAVTGYVVDIFSSTNTLKNYGRGYLQFTIFTYSWTNNTAHYNASINEIRVESGNNIFECDIGNVVEDYNPNTNYLLNVHSVTCPVNIGSSGITKITAEFVNITTSQLKTSNYMTFINDVDIENGGKLDTINSTLATYLQSVYNATYQTQVNTNATNNYLSAIQSLLNTDLTAIIQALTSSTSQIVSAQQQTTTAVEDNTQAVNDVNDTLNDSSTDNPSNSLSNMNSQIGTNTVISDLLTLPIRFYQTILNNVNSSCSPYNLGSLFNTNITLPCINIEDLLGSTIFTIIDIGLCGIFVWSIRKKFITIFQNITSLSDRGNELE